MWGDQFNFNPNEDILTPAEKRRLEEQRKAEEDANAPRFGNVRLDGKPDKFQTPQSNAMNYMPIESVVAGQNAYLNNLSNQMGNEVESAMRRENDSRVAQIREMRRMEHERYLEQMKIDALLKKLQLESQMAQQANIAKFGYAPRTVAFRGGMITHG
jgi:hypothetical protein